MAAPSPEDLPACLPACLPAPFCPQEQHFPGGAANCTPIINNALLAELDGCPQEIVETDPESCTRLGHTSLACLWLVLAWLVATLSFHICCPLEHEPTGWHIPWWAGCLHAHRGHTYLQGKAGAAGMCLFTLFTCTHTHTFCGLLSCRATACVLQVAHAVAALHRHLPLRLLVSVVVVFLPNVGSCCSPVARLRFGAESSRQA